MTVGVLGLRSGDLGGFLRSLGIGEREEQADRNAASWNERLVFAYIGGRIFLDQPVLGTGWHGQLPPEEYVQYLDDARERFPDLPANYFPDENGFIPQQTYDQVLYELGIVGALLFLAARRAHAALDDAGRARLAARRPGRARGVRAGRLGGRA